MVAFDPQSRHAAQHAYQRHNISHRERALSTAAGIVLTGAGLHRGGILGLAGLTLGGLLLARGGTGHCNLKGLLEDPQAEIRHLRARIRQLSATLAHASAEHSGTDVRSTEAFDTEQIPGGSYAVDPASANRLSGHF
ncbi:YgaP-like transmembrane domain [Pseudomonas sp. F(2018)]|uniref:YgaP-like transmembrane domain n=1 Tax=Pseudomonas sp. F(2018) TaxID=2502240 RepID=UPI0010F90B80|nr:YgaP-like transmembrane domain [Pseudomonas sp. F(2018)]